METKCKIEKKDIVNELDIFIRNWFVPPLSSKPEKDDTNIIRSNNEKTIIIDHNVKTIRLSTSLSSTLSSSSEYNLNKKENSIAMPTTTTCTTKDVLYKEDIEELFAWAFFDKRYSDLNEHWERQELNKMFKILIERYGIIYPSYHDAMMNNTKKHEKQQEYGNPNPIRRLKPCLMSLEDVNPLHRPLCIYILFWALRHFGYIILYYNGFRRNHIYIDKKKIIKFSSSSSLKRRIDCYADDYKSFYYWYRQPTKTFSSSSSCTGTSSQQEQEKYHDIQMDPLLFFHGIAPSGLTFYLPMLFHTFLNHPSHHDHHNDSSQLYKQKIPVFLFENLPITCTLMFDALTEEETVIGIMHALERHGYFMKMQEEENKKPIEKLDSNLKKNNNNRTKHQLILCGHSFGSCQITWLIKNKHFQQMVKKIVLLDPVSILLSEPDVVQNFIYGRSADNIFECSLKDKQSNIGDTANSRSSSSSSSKRKSGSSSITCRESTTSIYVSNLKQNMNRLKIRILASSEICIEHYLRRHFAWYNSELWIEDIPDHIQTSVFISEKDEIIDADKVKKEMNRFPRIKCVCWNGVGHASVISSPTLWIDVINDFVVCDDKSK